jgi:hypothetical protein
MASANWRATSRAGNRLAGRCRAAYAFRQVNGTAKSIYLYLSPETDFVAFRRILTKTHKTIETIDSIDRSVFSMVS